MIWLRFIMPVLLACLMTGCAALDRISSFGTADARKESLKRMEPARIQADTMGFSDRFVAAMTGVCDQLEGDAASPAAKNAAHQIKTDLALGAISNAVNPRPTAGLIDMVVMVSLMRQIAEDPSSAQTFGADTARLVQSLRRQEADIRSMARRYLTDPQLAELGELAERWHSGHPDERRVSHVHLADLPEANLPPEVALKTPSVFGLLFFDPTVDLDPAVREIELSRATSERMFFYLQRLPLLLQLQAEGFYRRAIQIPQTTRVLEDVSEVSAATTRFAEVSGRFTDVVAQFPRQLSQERQEAIGQLAAEVAQQREAAIRQLSDAVAAQREAAIRELAHVVAVQREAAITQATTRIASQREQAIDAVASVLREERKAFVANIEAATQRSIDRLVRGLAAVVLLMAVCGALVVFARYRARRRSEARA